MESILKIGKSVLFENVVSYRKLGEDQLSKNKKLIIDFSEMESYDSSLLALLLAWKRFAKRQEAVMELQQIPPSLKTFAAICNVQSILNII